MWHALSLVPVLDASPCMPNVQLAPLTDYWLTSQCVSRYPMYREAYKVHSNMSLSYIKLGRYSEALDAAERSIALDPFFVKVCGRCWRHSILAEGIVRRQLMLCEALCVVIVHAQRHNPHTTRATCARLRR